jgi:glycosyltransferase involved in cell wall biosynthesis
VTQRIVVSATDPSEVLFDAMSRARFVAVVANKAAHDEAVLQLLQQAASAPGVATASPVPVPRIFAAPQYHTHPLLPPAPSLALPCRALCVIDSDAASSLPAAARLRGTTADALTMLAQRLLHHGWRHVAAPGVALDWSADDATGVAPAAGWNAVSLANMVGPANAGLEAHCTWAASRLTQLRVVVDGACMSASPYTGTQHVVLEVARHLAEVRPTASVALAVPSNAVNDVRAELTGSSVEVVERSASVTADVLYRPYQMLYASELPFVVSSARRALVGQLDMIGFSNPSYHPSDQLFFFARNLQRHLMRTLDGVTFISEFGRNSTYSELPDLDLDRLHVVSCGADPEPQPGELGSDRPLSPDTPFLVCLASTFWHKNRAHAIATFAAMVDEFGYRGQLVLVGPEPYFGRSLDAETELLATLKPEVSQRVHRWGHVSDAEKWWLLRHAQLVLYPSVVEGFGLVPFEAASVGTPCLAHASTAPGELLGNTSAAMSTWSPSSWAARGDHLVRSRDGAENLVAEVVAAAQHHTWRRCGERTWDAIDAVLAMPRRTLHADDGGALARVSPSPLAPALPANVRFLVARGVPAVRRRLTGLLSKVRRPGAT